MDNSKTTRTEPTLSRAVLIEAAAWVTRMDGPLRTRATEQGFAQWLKDDPIHRIAFTEVSRDWQRMEDLRPHAHVLISAKPESSETQRARRHEKGPWLALAAMLALACVGAGWYFTRPTGIETAIGEQRILRLQDGTKVSLNTSTRMVVQYDDQHRGILLDDGEALFEVAPDAKRPFVVRAGDRQVTALGTAFLVRRDADRMTVTLMEGKVSVAHVAGSQTPDAKPTVLVPGERMTFRRGIKLPPQIDRPSLPKLVAWQQGQVSIDNSPLADAVAEMNRYSSIKLVIERPETAAMPLSGMFAAGQSMSFARAVAETYQLDVIDRGSTIVLSGVARRSLPAQ